MNSANTDTADTTKDTDGYEVTYMERRLPGMSGKIRGAMGREAVATRAVSD